MAGSACAFIALKSTGEAWGWGSQNAGSYFNALLGTNTDTNYSSPVAVVGSHNFVELSMGEELVVGMKTDGTAWTWGYAAPGFGAPTTKSSPVAVVGSHSFIHVAAGTSTAYGLKFDGTLWAWGDNSQGQLGDNTKTSKSSPVAVVGSHSYTKIAAWLYGCSALKADGTAWCWGYGSGMGDNTVTGKSSPVLVVGSHAFVEISAGGLKTLGRKADGSVWGWGDNSNAGLGDNTKTDRSSPVAVVGNHVFQKISSANLFSAGLKSDGTLWTWGDNANGQLGDNTKTSKSSPVAVVGSHEFTMMTAAGNYYDKNVGACFGLKSDGTAWSWGASFQGFLGDNTTTDKSSPVAVVGSHVFSLLADRTIADLPLAVTTSAVSSITATGATLNGNLTSLDGQASAKVWFDYRVTGTVPWTSTTAATVSVTGAYSKAVTGLSLTTGYDVRAACSNTDDSGIQYGSTVTFATLLSAATARRVVISDKEIHQLNVISRTATPPVSPDKGARYLIIATATGAWQGYENNIVMWNSTNWELTALVEGMIFWSVADKTWYRYNGSTIDALFNNVDEGYTTTATAASTTTLTVTSTYQQFFTGSTTQTVALPVTSTLVLGHSYLIANLSSGAVTINSSGGNAVIVLAAYTSAIVTCILLTGTTAASWAYNYFGTIITSAKSLSVSNTLTLVGTDGTTMTFPSSSKTIMASDFSNASSGTLPNNTVATTQSAGDNSTKVATTAYADAIQLSSHITILPWNYSSITQGTWATDHYTQWMFGTNINNNATAAQNDRINYKFSSEAGTWTMRMVYDNYINMGIITVLIDDVSIGTVDTYGLGVNNISVDFTGFTLTQGAHTLSLLMATLGSGSTYRANVNCIGLWRTA